MARIWLIVVVVTVAVISGCGGSGKAVLSGGGGDDTNAAPALLAAQSGLGALPRDGVQPWESVDSRGFVVPAAANGRTPSALPASAEFATGAMRFTEGGSVSDNGDASTLTAPAGADEVSYAIYRFTLGGVNPGVVTVDANLDLVDGSVSQYWVGLSDYGAGHWEWHGPLREAQVALVPLGASYASPFGNTFVAVAAYDGSALDVVGVAVNPVDGVDASAPPVPAAPNVTPVAGGLELSWIDVIAADLAGYQVYWSYSPFSARSDNGVQKLPWLENTTRLVLPVQWSRDVWVGISAADVNGYESDISPVVQSRRLSGAAPSLGVTVSQPSALRGESVTLSIAGGSPESLLYDIDTDGDGGFDITGDVSGFANIDTTATGLIRPRVRASTADGMAVALGSVSLIVTGNQRPVASGRATPSYGYSPLAVQYEGTGEDPDGAIVEFAWDTVGDGIYDKVSAVSGNFNRNLFTPGLYNAKFRVTDDQGAWDVDTVAIQVLAAEVGIHVEPGAVNEYDMVDFTVETTAPVQLVEWDIDGDGSYEQNSGTSKTLRAQLGEAGFLDASVRVTTTSGATLTGQRRLRVQGWRATNITPEGVTAYNVALAEINGAPAVCYPHIGGIYWVRALDPEGKTWSAPTLVTADGNGDSFTRTQILNVAGHPAIFFRKNGPDFAIQYIRSSDDDGFAWNAQQTVAVNGSAVGSPANVGGLPALTYTLSGNIRYARAQNAAGTAWDDYLVQDEADSLIFPRLAVVDGSPAIAYVNATTQDLLYERSENATGSSWGGTTEQPGVFYNAISMGGLLYAGGQPQIVWIRETTPGVYTSSISRRGTDFWATRFLEDRNFYNFEATVINGVPAYAYHFGGGLSFQAAQTPYGDTWHQLETADSGQTSFIGHIGLAEVAGMPAAAFTWSAGADEFVRFVIRY